MPTSRSCTGCNGRLYASIYTAYCLGQHKTVLLDALCNGCVAGDLQHRVTTTVYAWQQAILAELARYTLCCLMPGLAGRGPHTALRRHRAPLPRYWPGGHRRSAMPMRVVIRGSWGTSCAPTSPTCATAWMVPEKCACRSGSVLDRLRHAFNRQRRQQGLPDCHALRQHPLQYSL